MSLVNSATRESRTQKNAGGDSFRPSALIRSYNRHAGQIQPLLKKALTAASGVGEALVPEHLSEIITNTIIRLSPEYALLTAKFDAQKFHSFNRVTSLGAPGGAMGENSVTPSRSSTYERAQVELKVVRRKGAVSNFLQDASQDYIDAAGAEMENVLRAHLYDLNTYNLYGNATANRYEFSGLDTFIKTNRINSDFAGGVPTVPDSLAFLDQMIDRNSRRGGARHAKAFFMSPEMVSKVSQLLTNVRNNQTTADGVTEIEINGGWRLLSYRNIPIVDTTFLSGEGADTMDAVTGASGGTTGGSFSDGTYYFRVAKITQNGESMASAEVPVTLSGGTATQTVSLSFAADPDAYHYKVYYSPTSGLTDMTLIHMVGGFQYDVDGTVTGDTTAAIISGPSAAANGQVITIAQEADRPLTPVGGVNSEIVILQDLDEYQGLGKFAYTHSGGNRVDGLVSIRPLAETDDNLPFLIKSYGALIDSYEATSVIRRGLRVA